MEVILTLSNRITLAGAIPLLVAAALAVLVAALALAPSRPASAAASPDTCKISPVILNMLLDRYGKNAQYCDNLNLGTNGDSIPDGSTARGDTWDFSGKNLGSFSITDKDAEYLQKLTGSTRITESAVRYIDLTGNPLTVSDVDFKHIPANVAVKLTADTSIKGFQQEDYSVTEGVIGYISAAFPGMLTGSNTHFSFTADLTGDIDDDLNEALDPGGDKTKVGLVSLGTNADSDKSRSFEVNSDSGSVIFYWPLNVSKDNENDDDWDFTLTINEATGVQQGTKSSDNALTVSEGPVNLTRNRDSAEVTIVDADKPAIEVCDRSEDVEENILDEVAITPATYGGTSNDPRDCDELTTRDLGKITRLTIDDDDTDDREPLETLLPDDLSDLSGLSRLHIVGARALPSGIFKDVGKNAMTDRGADRDDQTVRITFAKNSPADSEDDSVGDFTPSTIPQHIWDDQEPRQVIVLADDKGSNDKGVTRGLDADLYAGSENGHFFVLTNAATAKYALGNSVSFAPGKRTDLTVPIIGTDSFGAGGGPDSTTSRVARFAVTIPDVDNEDKGDRSTWLFLFAGQSNDPVSNAGQLVDLASVAISDDD